MTERLTRRMLPLNQVLLILMGLLILYLLVDFGRQVSISQQRKQELEQIEQKTSAALEEQARLEELLIYVQSDVATEEWARKNGLVKPGEVPVVVVAPPADSSAQTKEKAEESTKPNSPRDAWWNLFFGTR